MIRVGLPNSSWLLKGWWIGWFILSFNIFDRISFQRVNQRMYLNEFSTMYVYIYFICAASILSFCLYMFSFSRYEFNVKCLEWKTVLTLYSTLYPKWLSRDNVMLINTQCTRRVIMMSCNVFFGLDSSYGLHWSHVLPFI